MNMALGCRERVGKEWFYYLMDGTKLTKEEWTSIVKKNIQDKGHQQILEDIKATVKLWDDREKIEDAAMHVYASKYCFNVVFTKRETVRLKPVRDDMGCTQLAFC